MCHFLMECTKTCEQINESLLGDSTSDETQKNLTEIRVVLSTSRSEYLEMISQALDVVEGSDTVSAEQLPAFGPYRTVQVR